MDVRQRRVLVENGWRDSMVEVFDSTKRKDPSKQRKRYE